MGGSSISLDYLLETFRYQAPHLLLYCIGIGFAIMRMKRARTPAMLVIVSLGILLLTSVIGTAIQSYIVMQMSQGGTGNWMWMLRGFGFAYTVIHALAIALLIYAVFVSRNPAPRSDD